MDSNHYASAVAANIETARRQSGLTKLSLAASSGIPRTSLDRKLNGRGDFTVREITALATALGTTPHALVTTRDVSAAA
ncbi:helix-turn-helix domain-containing protein [Oerskovia sp. NPDC057915]|uniref:helix-turn-helix domain-containing protein n=1 Tax=Oerskovia sp. NPDC057915 TaxID=3346280 RepID=UPI0036DD2D07